MNISAHSTDIPLCIDLDGTLLKTDMLHETSILLVKRNPLYVLMLPLWLLRGKAYLKKQIASRVEFDPSCLPYRTDLIAHLSEERATGRHVVLTTASDEQVARRIAGHLQLFDEVLASDGKRNLSGKQKLALLTERYGERRFAYAGNAPVDLHIWRHAATAIVIGDAELVRRAGELTSVQRVFPPEQRSWKTFLKAMRLHQWLKNLLIFVPLLTAHKFAESALLVQALLAFLSFGLCASSVYLLNDLLDLEADRHHPTKRRRPFAAGALPIWAGVALIPAFLLSSAAIARELPGPFQLALLIYLLATAAYSFFLKRFVLIDVLALAGLYTLRIIAGGAAVGIAPTQWLLTFSMFLFLSLALVKRFSELYEARESNRETAPESIRGRGYYASDLEQIASLGGASGYMSVLVLALYINSQDVAALYGQPNLLWLVCAVLLYWISRVWLLAHRGEMHEDPIMFAIKDRTSYIALALAAAILTLAT